MNIFSPTAARLEQAIQVATIKHNAISSNIANVDTPNYKSKEVYFQSELNSALGSLKKEESLETKRTHEKHIPFQKLSASISLPIQIKERANTLVNHNGNNVDIDYEMSQLAKNQLWYNALVDRMNGQFNSLKTVINEGR